MKKCFLVYDRVVLWNTFRGIVVRSSQDGYVLVRRDDKPWLSEPEAFHVDHVERLNPLDEFCEGL